MHTLLEIYVLLQIIADQDVQSASDTDEIRARLRDYIVQRTEVGTVALQASVETLSFVTRGLNGRDD